MAHELLIEDGKAAMAYVGVKPWHGLGQELTPNSPLEVWAKEAGMDYFIGETPVEFSVNDERKIYTGQIGRAHV